MMVQRDFGEMYTAILVQGLNAVKYGFDPWGYWG